MEEKNDRGRKLKGKTNQIGPFCRKVGSVPPTEGKKKEEPEDIKKREQACLADIKLLLYFVAGR